MSGDKCHQCKHIRSVIVDRYSKMRFPIDSWFAGFGGKTHGLRIGFWAPGENAVFFDLITIRKQPVRLIGIPPQRPVYAEYYHENSRTLFRSPRSSTMILPEDFDPRSTCALDFVSKLTFAPTFLIYCRKISSEVVDNCWYCIYDDLPNVVDISRVIIPVNDPNESRHRCSKAQLWQRTRPFQRYM